MKKFLMIALLSCSLQLVHAQELKKVQTNYLLTKFEDAKTEIDKVMADPKQQGKPDAIYWKAKVYTAIFKDKALRAKYPNSLKDAEDALNAYVAADPQFALTKQLGAEPFFDMYATTYTMGVESFNAKKWEEAATNFGLSVHYSDYIFQNKWSNSTQPFDTTSILYQGYSYQNAQKPDLAAKSYARLADSKVDGTQYMEIYKFLLNHYTIVKDETDFNKYLALAKELYPKEAWEEFEIDYMDQNLTLEQKAALYDKEDAAGTLSEMKYLQFGDIFVNAKNKDKDMDSLHQSLYALKAADAFKKAFGKNNQNAIAAFNVGVIYYNVYGQYDDIYAGNIRTMRAINAEKPVEKDPKKKAATEALYKQKTDPYLKANANIEKPLMDNLNTSLEWLEKTYTILNGKTGRNHTENSVLNKTVDFLANLYAYKRDRNRGKDAKLFDEFDAKFKVYDALHDKFN